MTSITNSKNGSSYEIVSKIGEGAYGRVYLAKCCRSGEMVALKSVKMANQKEQHGHLAEGMCISTLREIEQLKLLCGHENIVGLKDVVWCTDNDIKAVMEKEHFEWEEEENGEEKCFLVLEYCPHDLTGIIASASMVVNNITYGGDEDDDVEVRFDEALMKGWMMQLLKGVEAIHRSGSMHRDLKPSNILITQDCVLKIADFGLSTRKKKENGRLTNNVATMWYRAPELILGSTQYSNSIDMWSVGCIFGELLFKRALIPGSSELTQLEKIFFACGTPNKHNWSNVHELPRWHGLKPAIDQPSRLDEMFKLFLNSGMYSMIDLLKKMLVLDPCKRITAKEALNHHWFTEEPIPNSFIPLPTLSRTDAWVKEAKKHMQRHCVPKLPPTGGDDSSCTTDRKSVV